ncbi:restriction endonuclease subunit S [Chryseobacterium pennae]|nr:restriction endonuclease subunit S [Chryseobacterium pennae]
MFAFPNLRFPGFEGEWETKKLGEVVKINQGLQIAISERLTEKREGAYFYITNEFLKANSIKRYYILNPPKSVICEEEDILMTRTGNTGQVVTNVSGAFHNNFFKVAYPEYIIKNFLLNFLKSNKIQNQIIRLAGTSTIPDLNHSDFYKIKIIFPSTQEQKKISTLLSLLAQRIQTQKKIIEDNRKMKLELSHSLFTRSLKINQRYISKWEEKKLGDISTILMGQSPDSLAYNTDGKGLPLIQGNADIVQRFSEPRQFTSQITKTCDIGDIILTVRAPVGYVAKSKHFACIGRGVCAIKSNEKSDSEFIYQFLLYFENKWASFEQGSTFTSVNRSDIKTIKLNIPTIKEQKEIAKFLKAFDEKIKLEAELLNQYENQKKYLLQNLFV